MIAEAAREILSLTAPTGLTLRLPAGRGRFRLGLERAARAAQSAALDSRVHPAHPRDRRDAADRDDVRRRAHVDLVLDRGLQHRVERLAHLRFEALVHFLLRPEVAVA